jgi:hypothetical protein
MKKNKRKILPQTLLTELSTEALFELLFNSFTNGIRSAKADFPREYLKSKGLDWLKLNIGFNAGQTFHRATQDYLDAYAKTGFIWKSDEPQNLFRKAYSQFGIYSIIFPLRNEQKEIVNFYGIRIDTKKERHAYFNDKGLYPSFAPKRTQVLFLTETILDCATLLQSDVLDNREAAVALHNGKMLTQHIQLIESLVDLEQIIFINHKNNINE